MLRGLKSWGGRLPLHRWLLPRGAPAVVVLMYHDLRRDGDLANWLRVEVADFERQLAACADLGAFIGPDALLEPDRLPADRLGFLVTFDDGYRNNAELAAPLLERLQVPALFFVSTGPLESGRPFWTDVVITPIQALGLRRLDLTAHGLGRFTFRSGDEAARWDDIERLLVAIKSLGNEDAPPVAALLSWLRDRYAAVLDEHLPRFRPLQRDEVGRLAAGPLFTVGSHGHEHRILTRLDDAALDRSLVRSRQTLADLAGRPVEHLAYPNGNHDARVRRAAARAGYRLAFTVRSDLAAGPLPALALPRIAVGAFDTPELLRLTINRKLLAWRRHRGPRAFVLSEEQREPSGGPR